MQLSALTLGSVLTALGREYGATTALVFGEETYRYSEVCERSLIIARNITARGIRRNDKVAIIMSNSADYLCLYFACFLVGAWAVPISTRWEEGEVTNVLDDANVAMIVFEERIGIIDFGAMVQRYCTKRENIILVCRGRPETDQLTFESLCKETNADNLLSDVMPEDVALLAYTSGTTGSPKGVMISHRTLVQTSQYTAEVWDIHPGDVAFSVAPLYAAQGFLAVLIDLVAGVTMKWNTSFNPNDIIREFSHGGISIFHTQPTMWSLLLSQPAFAFVDFSGLEKVVVSGSLCSYALAERIEKCVGCKVLNAYGLIEATGVVTVTRMEDDDNTRWGTVGAPIPGVEYRIVDSNRNDVPAGETGELAVRGYVMKGYYNNPVKTAEVLDQNGWLYTGDLAASTEDGKAIRIVGRCKDMIIRGGFNVYPIDIEECIMKNDLVHDAAVVGKEDALLGESIVAFVIPKAGCMLTPGDVKRYCRGKIANYKVPDEVHIISQMPILLSGKIQKNVLRVWTYEGIPTDKKVLFDNAIIQLAG